MESMICVLCGHGGRGTPAEFHMTHGVSVWLCRSHRSPAFLRRRRGRVFAGRLEAVWRAAGTATRRRLAALDAHRRRMRGRPATRPAPGSYAWPLMRREAEERFAAGAAPGDVIADLRGRYRAAPATVPSVRTMRRWHTEARWLTTPPPARARPKLRRPMRSSAPDLPFHWNPDPFWPFSAWWVDDASLRRSHWRRR